MERQSVSSNINRIHRRLTVVHPPNDGPPLQSVPNRATAYPSLRVYKEDKKHEMCLVEGVSAAVDVHLHKNFEYVCVILGILVMSVF